MCRTKADGGRSQREATACRPTKKTRRFDTPLQRLNSARVGYNRRCTYLSTRRTIHLERKTKINAVPSGAGRMGTSYAGQALLGEEKRDTSFPAVPCQRAINLNLRTLCGRNVRNARILPLNTLQPRGELLITLALPIPPNQNKFQGAECTCPNP